MDIDGVKRRLARQVEKVGTQLAFAVRYGVSQAHISEVMNDKAAPSRALLAALDLEEVVRYRVKLGTPEEEAARRAEARKALGL